MAIAANDKLVRLRKMDDHRLIDAVKNYRQYGYSTELRAEIVAILEQRGVQKDQLELTGNFDNNTYDRAEDLYASYTRNSLIAFCLYVGVVLINVFSGLTDSPSINLVLFFIQIAVIGSYLVFIVMSFLNQNQFYKSIGKSESDGSLLYLLLGMPLYIFMYFYFKKQMKEQMTMIR